MAKRSQDFRKRIQDNPESEVAKLVHFLEKLKSSAEHTRRFSAETPPLRASQKTLTFLEGDIEEFLIENGYWESEDDAALA